MTVTLQFEIVTSVDVP